MSFQIPVSILDLLLNNKDFLNSELSIKKILSKRKNNFIHEYLKINNTSISSSILVKIDDTYKFGHLTLINSKLAVTQYILNKITYNLNETMPIHNRTITSFLNNESITQRENILFPIFFIDFNLSTCQLLIHKSKQKFRLIILGKNFTDKDYDNTDDYIEKYRIVKFKMANESRNVFDLICESINKSIILSNGYRYNIFSINIRNNFCQEYFMNYREFAKKANTGDIILFRGYGKESKLQRVFTSADYDHVGLLFRKDNILHLYESTGKDGVKLRPWSDFINYYWYLLYDKMAFRALKVGEDKMKEYIYEENKKYIDKLNIDESINNIKDTQPKIIVKKFYEFLNKNINDFIKHTEDKKYSFSKIGYLCNSTMRKNTINRKGYSCSELVAACYYYSGIITDKLEATNYLPGSFSRNGNIPFKQGFYLGEEYIIDFSSTSLSI